MQSNLNNLQPYIQNALCDYFSDIAEYRQGGHLRPVGKSVVDDSRKVAPANRKPTLTKQRIFLLKKHEFTNIFFYIGHLFLNIGTISQKQNQTVHIFVNN